MRQTKCSFCGTELPLRSCFLINAQVYCGPCADKKVSELEATNAPVDRASAIDSTVCYHCNADAGDTEFQTIKDTPLCPACYKKASGRHFPDRLKVGVAILVALLVFGAVRSIPYIRAARALSAGERLVNSGNYSEAIPLLDLAVKTKPGCAKCSLLLGKALLKIGDAPTAAKVLAAHNNGHYDSAPDILTEVNAIMARANKAWEKVAEADKAYSAKDKAKTVQLLNEAAAIYPENQGFAARATLTEIEIAFQEKNYDHLAELSKLQMQRFPEDAMAVGLYSSALACQYAVSGNDSIRAESEQVLQKAESLATSPEQKRIFGEYAERIRYRLQTRNVIDKDEYDRRFRQASDKTKPQH